MPVSRKNVQNTGEVYATMAENPSGVNALARMRISVTAPCQASAVAGVLPASRQRPRCAKAAKSRPNAKLVRAPVKTAAFIVVTAETHTMIARIMAPLSPAIMRMTSAATAFDSFMPVIPSAAR